MTGCEKEISNLSREKSCSNIYLAEPLPSSLPSFLPPFLPSFLPSSFLSLTLLLNSLCRKHQTYCPLATMPFLIQGRATCGCNYRERQGRLQFKVCPSLTAAFHFLHIFSPLIPAMNTLWTYRDPKCQLLSFSSVKPFPSLICFLTTKLWPIWLITLISFLLGPSTLFIPCFHPF